MTIRAVIFDMDGVLIESEPILTQICIDLFAEMGVRAVPADFRSYIGTGEEPFIRGVAEKHGLTYTPGLKARAYETYIKYLQTHDCRLPGTAELFAFLKQRGVKTAIASSADRIKLTHNIRAAGLREGDLQAVVAGDDVTHRKPHPEIYIKTAGILRENPASCLVIEDALAGIAAARAAGMPAVGLPTSFSPQQLTDAGACHVAAGLPALLAWLQNRL